MVYLEREIFSGHRREKMKDKMHKASLGAKRKDGKLGEFQLNLNIGQNVHVLLLWLH